MTLDAREYFTEGHRLLCESPHSPAEIATLSGQRRQRVSEWRTGQKRPTDEARAALERAVGIPVGAWECPPTRREPVPPVAAVAPRPAQVAPGEARGAAEGPGALPGGAGASLADVERLTSSGELPALGLAGLERLAARIRALEPSLPPRERVSALQAEARVLQAHEGIRLRAADSRDDFLTSAEFRDDVRSIVSALAGLDATGLRDRLRRLGVVDLPEVATELAPDDLDAPATLEDVDAILFELEVAKRFRDGGETALAAAHTAPLCLDANANALAALVLDDNARAARLLELVDATDERTLSTALARAMAVRDVKALAPEVRTVVAQLLELVGQEPLARQIGG
jgi:transcriptional regulator with XRE-family HTH domain